MNELNYQLLLVLARGAVGMTFVYAGILKLRQQRTLLETLNRLRVPFSTGLALAIPATEVILGTLLTVGVYQRAAALILLGLLLIFTIVLVHLLRQGKEFQCGCFGDQSAKNTGPWTAVRNLGLAALLFEVTFTPLSDIPWSEVHVSNWSYSLVVVLAVTTACAVIALKISNYARLSVWNRHITAKGDRQWRRS